MDPEPLDEIASPAYPTRREFLAGSAALLLAAGCGRANAPHPIVAPIFEHGEGRGSDGCIAVCPPVFLSEDEAMQVIKEELAKAGIQLGSGMPLTGVMVQWVSHTDSTDWLGHARERKTYAVSLDAVDRKNKVATEFIAHESYERLTCNPIGFVSGYDTRRAAEQVASAIRAQARESLRIGVF